jgi:CRP-like cAMP-binding protein
VATSPQSRALIVTIAIDMPIIQIPPERAIVLLAGIQEFSSLSSEDLHRVAEYCRWHRYVPEQEIVRDQDSTTDAFFLVQGSLRVTHYSSSGQEVILSDLSAGDMFGELTAIDGLARSALVVAKVDSIVASLSSSDFLNLFRSNSQVSLAILKRLVGQVRRLTDRVYEYSTQCVPERIQAELLRSAKNVLGEPNRGLISPAPTDTDLASFLSTTREAVNRARSKMESEGLITKENHEIHILDMAKLRKMVQKSRGC